MNRQYIIFFIIFLCSNLSSAQLEKNNWLVGGTAYFGYAESKPKNQPSSNSFAFSVNPNIGYFLDDNISAGLVGGYYRNFAENSSGQSSSIGPFLRYYLLKTEKPLNIFTHISYEFDLSNNEIVRPNVFTSKVGIVYFLNSSVGLECALNYRFAKSALYTDKNVFLNFGLQIHLEPK